MEFTRPTQPVSTPPYPRPVNDVTAPSVTGATAVDAEGKPDALPVHNHAPAELPQTPGIAGQPVTAPPMPGTAEDKPTGKPDDKPEGKTDAKDKKADKHEKAKKPEKIKANVQPSHSHGTAGAIFAAVVIILGLGAMFTYAYLRSQNIAVF